VIGLNLSSLLSHWWILGQAFRLVETGGAVGVYCNNCLQAVFTGAGMIQGRNVYDVRRRGGVKCPLMIST